MLRVLLLIALCAAPAFTQDLANDGDGGAEYYNNYDGVEYDGVDNDLDDMDTRATQRRILDTLSSVWEKVKDTAGDSYDTIKDAAGELADKVKESAADAYEGVMEVGKKCRRNKDCQFRCCRRDKNDKNGGKTCQNTYKCR